MPCPFIEKTNDSDNTVLQGRVTYNDIRQPLPNSNMPENPLNDVAIDETWKYVAGAYSGVRSLGWLNTFRPYVKDIWAGRKLIFHKPFRKMSSQDLKDYGRLGEGYYRDYLQKHPINIKDYGEVSFGKHNRGKDFIFNYEQYPFLRKNIENAKKENFSTNYKNEPDRVYDYFSNTHNGNFFHYLIENIKDVGKRYKMMKNKTKGE